MSIFLANALKPTYKTLVCLVFDSHNIHAAPVIGYNGIMIVPRPNMYNKTKITEWKLYMDPMAMAD